MYYGIGVLLGILVIQFFWDKKDIKNTYLPSARILNDLSKKELNYSPEVVALMNTSGLSKQMISEGLSSDFFDAQLKDREAKPCKLYDLEFEFRSKTGRFVVQNCDSVAYFQNLEFLP